MGIRKFKRKSKTCVHLGHEVNFSQTWWCNKQFDYPSEVHLKCDCKHCPDFERIEYTEEYTE